MSSRWTRRRRIVQELEILIQNGSTLSVDHYSTISSNGEDEQVPAVSDQSEEDEVGTSRRGVESDDSFIGGLSSDTSSFDETSRFCELQSTSEPEQSFSSSTDTESQLASQSPYSFSGDSLENREVYLSSSLSSDSSLIMSSDESASDSENKEVTFGSIICQQLASIKVKHCLTYAAMKDIISLVRSTGIEIPKDPRTIAHTDLTVLGESNTVHFGLKEGIFKKLSRSNNFLTSSDSVIKIQLSIDGIPLYKNSAISFWPVLCRIVNCTDSNPFPVLCFCGEGKPPSVKEYLRPLIDELRHLINNGFKISNVPFKISVDAIICDAAARSFVKGIKSHCAYGGCERCVVKGIYYKHRVVFDQLREELRSDDLFRQMYDDRHHNELSPFIEIESIDMVFSFVLDYMHLVCLGVMRRMFTHIWLASGRHCFQSSDKKFFNKLIEVCNEGLTNDFARKGSPIDKIKYWKAVQYRTFLLYTGLVILKKILSPEKYQHFIYFFVGIRLLASPKSNTQQILFAGQCLEYFVSKFKDIYGLEHLVYNVHSLIHLAQDCINNGPLDSFSAFPFENYLGKMKRLIRGQLYKPLAGLKRKLSEINHVESLQKEETIKISRDISIGVSNLCIHRPADRWCRTESGLFVEVIEITENSVSGLSYGRVKDARGNLVEVFEKPCKGSSLDIFLLGNRSVKRKWNIKLFDRCQKCVIFRWDHYSKLCIPVLHHQ